MPEILDWQRGDPRQMLQCAVKELTAGRLVVFPTETGYQVGASMSNPEALAALGRLAPSAQAVLAVRSLTEAVHWAPTMSVTARRIGRRVWPGPVTLVLDDDGQAGDSPPRVAGNGSVRLRVAGHEAILGALELLNCPIVLGSLPIPPTSMVDLVASVRDKVALIIDDGPTTEHFLPTVIQVRGGEWTVTQTGAVTAEMLKPLMPTTVLFVCTGNTCRSPLAETLCKKLLAERIGCKPEELPAHGFLVHSAGLAAMAGMEASREAAVVASELGADLSGHRSRQLTATLLARADHMFTMTQSHLRALLPFCFDSGSSPRLLASDGSDIADPIGGEPEVYRECAQQILRYLQECLPGIQKL